MAINASYNRSLIISGLNFAIGTTVSSDLATTFSESIAAAKAGTLSVRTDANTGTLTMASGHGITTGARLDLYWSGGRRYGVTVGSVSGTSVPIDLGAGDDLPAVDTAITAQVPTSEAVVVTGDDAVSIAVSADQAGTAVFAASDNSTILAVELTSTGLSYVWTTNDGGTNPFAGASVAKVFLSQPSATVAATMQGAVQFN